MFKEPAIRVPSLERLKEIARDTGLDVPETDLQSYQRAISTILADTYQRLYELPDPKLPVKYPRTPGYRPSPEDNPYNAWFWRCDIKGAPRGKLHGKTVAIKDNTCIAGLPLMNGSQVLEGFISDTDATVVTRILDAGGHIIGKAACENLCYDAGSFTSVTGPVLNPYNSERMANGSSSGSAALVASGHVDMALGGDQGGSIRMPAAACGIVGLKPTYGLVPYTGIMQTEFTLDHVGPMARTVYDTALMLEVIAGLDGDLDPRQPRDLYIDEPYTSKISGEISHLKLAILKEGFGLPSSEPDVDRLVRKAADHLRSESSAVVEDVSVAMHHDGARILQGICAEGVTRTIFEAGLGTGSKMYNDRTLQEAFSRGLKTRPNDLPIPIKKDILLGRFLLSEYHGTFYSKSQNLGRELCRAYDKVLEDYDVLLMPTIPKTAQPFPPVKPSIADYLRKVSNIGLNTAPFNVTGHPALSINAGFSNGLPVGMMIVGRKFDEASVLNIAYAYEKIRHAGD